MNRERIRELAEIAWQKDRPADIENAITQAVNEELSECCECWGAGTCKACHALRSLEDAGGRG